jgi:hypothetical protein
LSIDDDGELHYRIDLAFADLKRMRGPNRSTYGFRLLAAMVVVAALGAWIFLFRLYEDNFGSALSGNQAAWGSFGQYIGGLLTPILGTLTLVGVLYVAHLQRDAVADGRRAQKSQRRHYRRKNFERVFFRMLDTIDARFEQTSIKFRSGELQHPVTGAGARLQPAESGEEEIKGPKAFAQFMKIFGARALLPIRRGDYPGRDPNVVLRAKARELIAEYDHVVGPPLRLMCDLLIFLDDFDARYCRPRETEAARPAEDKLRRPEFYARIAMNARTRYELKVLAMYTGSDLVPPDVVRIAHAYGIFELIEPTWWGREAFLSD